MNSHFRLFCENTFLQVFGNPNASAPKEADTQAQRATESAESGASELQFVGPCQYVTCMHQPGEAGCASPSAAPPCGHQWLRPDNATIECAACGVTRWHYGD